MIRLLCRQGLVAVVGCAISCGTADAGPISYVESSGGDLPGGTFGVALPTFAFDVGINTISGTSGDYLGNGVIDWDSFAFVVPVGMELVSGNLELTRSGRLSRLSWEIYQGSLNFRGGSFVEELDPDFFAVFPFPLTAMDPLNAVPLSAGVYNVSADGLGGLANQPNWGTYTFTFDVRRTAASEVPEPASLTLIGMGALGFTAASRRRWRQCDW